MCVTALLAVGMAAAGALGSMAASISAANANKKAAHYQAAMEEKRLYEQREMQRIAALQQENGRASQYNQTRSAALAAIGASGLGEHISFFQSIDPEAKKNFLRDVSTVRLNMTQQRASIADQVQVTEFKSRVADYNATMSKVGAVADFVKTAASALTMYAGAATPAAAGGASSATPVPIHA